VKVYVKKGKRGKWILRWFVDGVEKQATTQIPAVESKRKLAEREAALKEQELEKDSLPPQDWDEFRKEYLKSIDGQAKEAVKGVSRSLSWLEEICNPTTVQQVDSRMLSQFVTGLRAKGLAQTTINDNYLKRVKAAINWAFDMGFIPKRVKYKQKQTKVSRDLRTREVTTAELERMVQAAKIARPTDYQVWQFYLKGLFYSGLRRTESIHLGWEWEFDFSVDISGQIPQYTIMGEGQKSGKDQQLTMVPEFAELLETVPKRQRRGRVFKLPKRGEFPDKNQVTRIVRKIAEVANVKVTRSGDFATPQIFRRSFGTRWAKRIMPAELQMLMRHEDIETTMKYYVNVGTEDLWKKLNQKEEVKR